MPGLIFSRETEDRIAWGVLIGAVLVIVFFMLPQVVRRVLG